MVSPLRRCIQQLTSGHFHCDGLSERIQEVAEYSTDRPIFRLRKAAKVTSKLLSGPFFWSEH